MDSIDLEEDDNELWQQISSEFQPLKRKESAVLVPRQQQTRQQQTAKNPERKVTTIPSPPIDSPKQKSKSTFLEVGDLRHVDGSVAKKLKDGSYPIDATLDLHGLTQDEAFETLRYFITTAYNMGKRCILIITGKGLNGAGVLHEQLPKWLSCDGLCEYVLAINQAQPKHGGGGAFYVLLRNKEKAARI